MHVGKDQKAHDQSIETSTQELADHSQEISSISVNEITNSNTRTQDTSVTHKKMPKWKYLVQHYQQIQVMMDKQTQPSQVTQNTDNAQMNQGAINIQNKL
ncbi:Hypothetical_protein [Hexamita inflata]|uniref:Hypothetical_protein n=1 Tax=Hexamita inflata TaxID=28002 RepID=A0AA86VAL4_9EUKA|nr:Hypothetical protein HINF_LOCUS48888 [Hexamita inflata]CAI9961250.1 Hypothetical protein HINF_LOCUS48895 [Hexamita inflata]